MRRENFDGLNWMHQSTSPVIRKWTVDGRQWHAGGFITFITLKCLAFISIEKRRGVLKGSTGWYGDKSERRDRIKANGRRQEVQGLEITNRVSAARRLDCDCGRVGIRRRGGPHNCCLLARCSQQLLPQLEITDAGPGQHPLKLPIMLSWVCNQSTAMHYGQIAFHVNKTEKFLSDLRCPAGIEQFIYFSTVPLITSVVYITLSDIW